MSYDFVLTDDEKRELLRIARTTLREYFYSGRIPPGKPHRDSLTADAGVFVSLHNNGALRGCIGTLPPGKPLFRLVQEMSIAAAVRDPRFEEVTEGELDDIAIEVSVLGQQVTMTQPGDIRIGEHGLTIEHNGRRGLLLPQVATENDCDHLQFLERVCIKAGLPRHTWKDDGARIELFTAQVFSDHTHPPLRRASNRPV